MWGQRSSFFWPYWPASSHITLLCLTVPCWVCLWPSTLVLLSYTSGRAQLLLRHFSHFYCLPVTSPNYSQLHIFNHDFSVIIIIIPPPLGFSGLHHIWLPSSPLPQTRDKRRWGITGTQWGSGGSTYFWQLLQQLCLPRIDCEKKSTAWLKDLNRLHVNNRHIVFLSINHHQLWLWAFFVHGPTALHLHPRSFTLLALHPDFFQWLGKVTSLWECPACQRCNLIYRNILHKQKC